MKKVLSVVLAISALLCIAALAGCKKEQEKEYNIDIVALATELSKIKYNDELANVNDAAAETIIGSYINGAKKYVFYSSSSGATPEMIITAEYETKNDAANGLKQLQKFVDEKKKTFDSYNVEYRPLLDKIVFESIGKYVVLCVSGDNTAAENIVSEYKK